MKNFNDQIDSKEKAPVTFRKNSIDFQVPKTLAVFLLLLISMSMSSCAVVGGIFKAGMGVGIFLVVLVIVGIVFLISRSRRK